MLETTSSKSSGRDDDLGRVFRCDDDLRSVLFCAGGRLVSPPAAELAPQPGVRGHRDSAQGDEDYGEEDEDPEHALVRHQDDQEELGRVEKILEAVLDPPDDAPLLLLHLHLLHLGDGEVGDPEAEPGQDDPGQEDSHRGVAEGLLLPPWSGLRAAQSQATASLEIFTSKSL